MPAIKKTEYCPRFSAAQDLAQLFGEDNDCAVKAVALACGQEYTDVLKAMNAMGRKPRKGTPWAIIDASIQSYGYKKVRVHISDVIGKYPLPHCKVLKNFTSHHPRRFPGCLDADKAYLIDFGRHVATAIGGQIVDWSINNSLRAIRIFEIVKAD